MSLETKRKKEGWEREREGDGVEDVGQIRTRDPLADDFSVVSGFFFGSHRSCAMWTRGDLSRGSNRDEQEN